MEDIQQQVILLGGQVAALEAMIQALPAQIVSSVLSQQAVLNSSHTSPSRHSAFADMEGQSFLLDEGLSGHNRSTSHEMGPEAQIQRLTAQLTAAYNRIAALEEQLLAQRLMQP